MKMQVKNSLARVSSWIDDHTEAIFGNTLLARQFCDHEENLTHNNLIVRLQIQNRGDMLARNDQDMDRRLRTNVPEGDYGFVSVNDIPFNSAFNNATEKTITHQSYLSAHAELSILVTRMTVLYKYLFSLDLEGHTLERGT
jgi:hypothetical protein